MIRSNTTGINIIRLNKVDAGKNVRYRQGPRQPQGTLRLVATREVQGRLILLQLVRIVRDILVHLAGDKFEFIYYNREIIFMYLVPI